MAPANIQDGDSCDFVSLAVAGVQGLSPYLPGKPLSELQREYGITDAIKLASNENPLGPSPLAIEALQTELSGLARYPDGNGFELKTALATKLSVASQQITLGNGSNDVLEMIARAFAGIGDEIIFSQHAFAVYPIVTQAVGARAVVTPARGWGHDLDAMRAAVSDKSRIIFIANPNNPTGTWLEADVLKSFIASVAGNVIVVVDEAYFEYARAPETGVSDYPDAAAWLSEFQNLIVTRTFSKAYGLAGLRIGYSLSHAGVAEVLNRVRQPFNCNTLALRAATVALNDTQHLQDSIQLNTSGLAQLSAGFEELGLSYIPSAGNFISVKVAEAAMPIYEGLLRQGVIVRPVENYRMPGYLRISVGLEPENARCLAALAKLI